ncbi:hypothetical protein EDD15DRAFT_1728146 [Pisolithus albus]|nr:hypothetical protein EDD15DRAFT_1728146 [Pisolithus albus]
MVAGQRVRVMKSWQSRSHSSSSLGLACKPAERRTLVRGRGCYRVAMSIVLDRPGLLLDYSLSMEFWFRGRGLNEGRIWFSKRTDGSFFSPQWVRGYVDEDDQRHRTPPIRTDSAFYEGADWRTAPEFARPQPVSNAHALQMNVSYLVIEITVVESRGVCHGLSDCRTVDGVLRRRKSRRCPLFHGTYPIFIFSTGPLLDREVV